MSPPPPPAGSPPAGPSAAPAAPSFPNAPAPSSTPRATYAPSPGSVTIIVFADDPSIAQMITDVGSRRAGEWTLHVATDVSHALEHFGRVAHVDVVVGYARPGAKVVDALLDHARRHSPQTARVVLADPADHESSLRLSSLAHQFLPIPLDVELVCDLIDHIRTAADTSLLDPVRTLVGQIDRLPSPPAMFQRLASIMASADWSMNDLANEVSQDVALTGELLKLVNSSFYGTARKVTSVAQAISLIGIDMTRSVVLGGEVFRSSHDLETWIDLDRLANRSKAIAYGTRALAVRAGADADTAAAAYMTGMVSEIGLLVLARIPDIAPSIAAPVNVSTFLGAERAIFGGDRFEVGAHLLTLWGFDSAVIDAVTRLSTGEISRQGELAWYLAASRQLVMGDGFAPADLASEVGANPAVDAAIDALRQVIEGAAVPAGM